MDVQARMQPHEALLEEDRERYLRMFETMLLIRAFDSTLSTLYTQNLVHGSTHPAIGQEAVAVGACAALEPADYITSTHRGHGHAIAKGANVRRMMAELLGRSDGYCRGKGGSMHIADFSIGMLGANGIVGGGLGIAAGAALSASLLGSKRVALCFFGDGAISQGAFLEVGNLAAIWRLPFVLVCENNQFAMSARPNAMTALPDLSQRAAGLGIPGWAVDGMDVLAVRDAVLTAVHTARDGGGPSLVVANCYRFLGHFSGDTLKYRARDEPEPWLKRDPITLFRQQLLEAHMLSQEASEDMAREAEAEVADALEFARASPFPDPREAEEDIYA